MKQATYDNLFDLFRRVGWKCGFKSIADSRSHSEDVFQSMIHKIMNYEPLKLFDEEQVSISNEFRFPEDLLSYFFKAFKNAYIDEVRSASYRKEHDVSPKTDEVSDEEPDFVSDPKQGFKTLFLGDDDRLLDKFSSVDPIEPLSDLLRREVDKIFSEIKWENKRLLSFRYLDGFSLEECSKLTGIPRATLDRRIDKIVNDLKEQFKEIVNQNDHETVKRLSQYFRFKLWEWRESSDE